MINSYRPTTVEEALQLIHQKRCHIFAGGTDLMIRKRQWQGAERKFTQPVVFINGIDSLKNIEETDTHYIIGALVTQTEMAESHLPEYIRVPYAQMSHPAIRNIATVGGNIVNAASVADSIPILLALDAEVTLQSVEGERTIPLGAFILGKYKTVRKDNELLTYIHIPKKNYNAYYYKKIGQRKASILSKVSVFIVHHKLDEIAITIGAVNPMVIRSVQLEKQFIKDHSIPDLIQGFKAILSGVNDKRSTKDYRETVAINMIKTYLEGVINEL
ncbi:MAG: FAD binding domain-containing protein [Clostridia bacterium]|nr:FAD binding domain-containing protein [Clostridia bacterium]